MSARDFMPFSSANGGHVVTAWAPLNAGESFREGEMVVVNNDGELAEGPVDDTQLLVADSDSGTLGGVAAMDGDTARTDGFARSTGDRISYYPWNEGTIFITSKVRDTGAIDTQIVPAGNLVGEACQITGTNLNGEWVLETGVAGVAGTDVVAHIFPYCP